MANQVAPSADLDFLLDAKLILKSKNMAEELAQLVRAVLVELRFSDAGECTSSQSKTQGFRFALSSKIPRLREGASN